MKPIRALGCLVAFAIVAAGAFYAFEWQRQSRLPVGVGDPVRLEVSQGASAKIIAETLEKNKVIRSARYFRTIAGNAKIKPGIYDLSPTDTPETILKTLEKGSVATVRQTFPEGFTLRRVAARLRENSIADETLFLELTEKEGKSFTADFPLPDTLEGYLFPDTYRFPIDIDERGIAQRMLDNFSKVVYEKHGDAIRRSKYSLHELITIASMVEREARVDQDRAKIAGVIYNRLRIRMPLQIDATVQYARGQHKERLLYKDLELESPYNTYRRRGLPPGPICCPGMPSIEAALSPETSDFLFYVARPDGSHVFSRTFAEHRRNIAAQRGR